MMSRYSPPTAGSRPHLESKAAEKPKRLIIGGLIAIFVLALGLRTWGISFGLPYDFTPDEVHEIVRALKLGAGEYTWMSGKGGLYYFLFLEYGALFSVWWLTGKVTGPTDFATLFLTDPTAFYLAGRITVALMGAFTCVVIYAVGQRIYDVRVGLASALIAATSFSHAMWSHHINVDTGMLLAMWGSILAYLVYERGGSRRWLLAAGSIAGVSFAFKLPGIFTIFILFIAIATPLRKWSAPGAIFKEAGLVALAMVLTVAVISPENIAGLFSLHLNFSNLLSESVPGLSAANDLRGDINAITIYHTGDYFKILTNRHNIALTVFATVGTVIGCLRGNRWDMIWSVFILTFLTVMILADRPGTEYYMFPIFPALWLLSARAVITLAGGRKALLGAGLAVIIIMPLFALIQKNHTWTRPDTRVLAKEWIEEHIPSGAKILMDGMQYRFIHSPPLNPNIVAVARRLEKAEKADGRVSRGVSDRTLSLYAEAMSRVSGPTYDLHSTIWGLRVQELDYYARECFDYVITSSFITGRFEEVRAVERFPMSVRFYSELARDPRFKKVYSIEPAQWKIQGPSITVYEVESLCS